MQLKKVFITLAVPAICIATAVPTPQDPVKPNGSEDSKIIGGKDAKAGDVPYIAAVIVNGKFLCGGSLLNANTVVTAAHCIEEDKTAANYSIRVGSLDWRSGGVVSQVTKLIRHPKHSYEGFDYDVGILKLTTPVHTSSSITYATLAPAGNDPAAGTTLTLAGWGHVSVIPGSREHNRLQKVNVPVVARDTCSREYPDSVTDNMICGGSAEGGHNGCHGDSGGPVYNSAKTLIGLDSWAEACAEANKATVYTRVGSPSISDFIRAHL